MDAYSRPITPAPTTVSVRGMRRSSRMPSESSTVAPSKSTPAGRAGRVPTAITIRSACTRWRALAVVDRERVRVDEARPRRR